MTERSRGPRMNRSDAVLALAAVALGGTLAAAYAAYRAVSVDAAAASERWSEFADAMLWPGSIIFVAVAAMVWFGWKLNID